MKVSDTPKGPARLVFAGIAGLLAALVLIGPMLGQGTGADGCVLSQFLRKSH